MCRADRGGAAANTKARGAAGRSTGGRSAHSPPPARPRLLTAELITYDVDVSWWITADAHAAGYYTKLYDGLRHWLATEFPFWRPYYSNIQIPSMG